jgi:hypothetical protein
MRPSLLVAILVPLASCGGGGDTSGPPDPGTIQITTTTSGAQLDADGYAIALDGTSAAAIDANATIRLDDISPGEHLVRISGLAVNCTLAPEHQTVSVAAGKTTAVVFQVTCLARTGGLEITTETTGAGLDPDGYILTLDGKNRFLIGINARVTFPDLTAGTHTVGLKDIVANCELQGESPRAVTVTGGTMNGVLLRVSCT